MLHLVILLAAAPRAAESVPAFFPAPPPLARSIGWGAPARGAIGPRLGDRDLPVAPTHPSREQTPPSEQPLEAAQTFGSVLDEAKRRYFDGDTDHARQLLEGLQLRLYDGEEAEWDLVVDALIYLGEIYYGLGLHDQAMVAFRYLLERDPDTPISPFHHAMELVNLFELVRTTVRADRDADPPPPVASSPLPVWAFLPFGVPQLLQGRTGAGVAYGLLQIGLGAASIGLYVNTSRLNPTAGVFGTFPRGGDNHPLWGKNQIPVEIDRLKYTMQWPATFGFYGLWGISLVDSAVWHSRNPSATRPGRGRDRRGEPSAAHPGGPTLPLVHVRGRF